MSIKPESNLISDLIEATTIDEIKWFPTGSSAYVCYWLARDVTFVFSRSSGEYLEGYFLSYARPETPYVFYPDKNKTYDVLRPPYLGCRLPAEMAEGARSLMRIIEEKVRFYPPQ